MSDNIRIKRLEKLALERAGEVANYELSDPRVEMVTITRAQLTKDFSFLTLYWSVMGDDGAKSKAEHALERAAGVFQREIGDALQTRRTPRVRFKFDASIAGAIEMDKLLDELRQEREEREAREREQSGDGDPPAGGDIGGDG